MTASAPSKSAIPDSTRVALVASSVNGAEWKMGQGFFKDFVKLPFPFIPSKLKTRIVATDGLLIVTPEYNNSIPGVLKNAFDSLSRPAEDIQNVFGGRPVAVIDATPGQGGTSIAKTAWLPV